MKLGLILKNTNDGESEVRSINKQKEWARYASDARSAIKELQGFDGSDKTVYLLKFLGGVGYLLSVIKSRPKGSGRPNDNTAAWIFVPSAVVVSAAEMKQVLKKVEEAISESKGVDNAKLEETFSKDYATKNVLVSAVGTISHSVTGNYALRYYNGDYRLNELLGDHLAQAEYARYKGVFFAENNSGIGLSTNDVLNFEPKQFITLPPLKSVGGFVAGIYLSKEFTEFDKDIELATDTKIKIEWRRENYAPIVKTFTAGHNNTADLEIKDFEKKVRIQRSWFKVLDPKGNPISNAEVSINGQLIRVPYTDVSEDSFNGGISVDIQSEGFEGYHGTLRKNSSMKDIRINLQPRKYNMEYTVPIYDEEGEWVCDAKLTLVDANKKLYNSPLKGYEKHGDELTYCTEYKSKIKMFVYGFISCLIIILLYAGVQALEEYKFQLAWPPIAKKVGEKQEKVVVAKVDKIEASEASVDSITIAYLDKNKAWEKDSLDKYEETKGMFDELNKFDIDALKKRVEDKKLSSETLQSVISALQQSKDNGFDPHKGKESYKGNYNKPSDNKIPIDNYIKWVSENHAGSGTTNRHQPKDVSSTNSSPQTGISRITGGPENTHPTQGQGKNATQGDNGGTSKRGSLTK